MPKKYLNITYEKGTRGGVFREVDAVNAVEHDIYPQLQLLSRLMPEVAYVVRWRTGGVQEPRYHDRYHELIVITEGAGAFMVGKKRIAVQARDIVLIKPGELHHNTDDSDFTCIAVHFSLTTLSERIRKHAGENGTDVPEDGFLAFLARHYTRIRKVAMAEGSLINNKAVEVLDEFNRSGAGARLMCSLAALELLVMVARNYLFAVKKTELTRDQVKERDRIMVQQVTDTIQRTYMEPLRVEELFRPFYLHPNYCRTIFKKVTGTSVRAFIKDTRMDAARSMIIDTDLTLEQVAGRCGFNDYFNFLRAFKRAFGVTAGSLRKKGGF